MGTTSWSIAIVRPAGLHSEFDGTTSGRSTVLALVVSGGIAFAIGNRGTALSSLAILLMLPTFLGMLVISLRLFPPDVDVAREGRATGDSDKDRELDGDGTVNGRAITTRATARETRIA